jgi:hypothetical protein
MLTQSGSHPGLQVQQQIKKGSAVKQAIANFFFSVSRSYIRAQRVVNGVSLDYARTSRPLAALLLATVTSAVLAPLHKCAQCLMVSRFVSQ